MTAGLAAVLLAGAILAAPSPPRRRLIAARPRRRLAGRLAGVCAVGAGALVAILATPAVAIAAGAASAVVVSRRRRRARQRRRRQEGDDMAAGLEVLVGELRVGAHPVHAFEVAAKESSGAVGQALRVVAGRARLGADVAGGLHAVAADSSVPIYWERMAICWKLASEHGLAMSALMRAAHQDIVARQRFTDGVVAGTAAARATAGILAGLPALGVLLGELIGAHPVRFLSGGGIGGWMLLAGVALIWLGVWWSDRIVDGVSR